MSRESPDSVVDLESSAAACRKAIHEAGNRARDTIAQKQQAATNEVRRIEQHALEIAKNERYEQERQGNALAFRQELSDMENASPKLYSRLANTQLSDGTYEKLKKEIIDHVDHVKERAGWIDDPQGNSKDFALVPDDQKRLRRLLLDAKDMIFVIEHQKKLAPVEVESRLLLDMAYIYSVTETAKKKTLEQITKMYKDRLQREPNIDEIPQLLAYRTSSLEVVGRGEKLAHWLTHTVFRRPTNINDDAQLLELVDYYNKLST